MRTALRHNITHYLLPFILLIGLCLEASALSPAEAAEQAKNQTGGKILQVKSVGENAYRVKVLMPNGQVRILPIGQVTDNKNDKEQQQ